ncbi:unnamed protein product [Didymodactylos carnosus]|uniref:JmjC domain-containing protein n=1 Tax=Didymodactylos carnosus TaxID=1234261 RepID=A0A814JPU9_9BILA|nr:unnamed protein product [Didymodactylos carnosus]CAF1040413.1 unnamed protein product [Didymodactylos carnosus]CAF3498205.1 unnamed protein product [Didymodactylos carnosus]CAF3810718.1 unnamed protein product [Didymodactylos carnosus]
MPNDLQNPDKPIVFRHMPINRKFSDNIEIDYMVNKYGHKLITLSTANTYSYEKVSMSLRDYINLQQKPNKNTLGNETLYWFGGHHNDKWLNQILKHYNSIPYTVGDFTKPSYSFGIAAQNTGVPFHFHGPGFQQIIQGRKHWILSKPLEKPNFNPNETTGEWIVKERQQKQRNKNTIKYYECILNPGDIIYFPNRWWHATWNLDFTVFISTFLSQ